MLCRRGVGCALCAVSTDQVVHPVSATRVLVQQRRLLQAAQHPLSTAGRQPDQVGRHEQADVRSGRDGQQPERFGLFLGQRLVRPGQHRGQARGRIVVGQAVRPEIPALRGGSGQREAGPAGDHAQSQRQAATAVDQLVDRRTFGVHPAWPEAHGQQAAGHVVGEHLQRHAAGVVGGDQARETVAAGHQHQRRPAAGQQRPDLLGAAALSSTISIRRPGTRLRNSAARSSIVGRDVPARHAQSGQEPASAVGRRLRAVVGVEAAQVHVTAGRRGTRSRRPVRPAQGQRRSCRGPPVPVTAEMTIAPSDSRGSVASRRPVPVQVRLAAR